MKFLTLAIPIANLPHLLERWGRCCSSLRASRAQWSELLQAVDNSFGGLYIKPAEKELPGNATGTLEEHVPSGTDPNQLVREFLEGICPPSDSPYGSAEGYCNPMGVTLVTPTSQVVITIPRHEGYLVTVDFGRDSHFLAEKLIALSAQLGDECYEDLLPQGWGEEDPHQLGHMIEVEEAAKRGLVVRHLAAQVTAVETLDSFESGGDEVILVPIECAEDALECLNHLPADLLASEIIIRLKEVV